MLVQKGELTKIHINDNGKISKPQEAYILSIQILYGCKCGNMFLITNIFDRLDNKVKYCPYCGSSEKITIIDTLDLTIPAQTAEDMATKRGMKL
jgi:hypothetical protein